MTIEAIFQKDPNAVLDYCFDWTTGTDTEDPWLATGETITTHTITVPDAITKDSDSESAGIVTVWLSGGTAGETYDILCRIVTSLGRTDDRTITIEVYNR